MSVEARDDAVIWHDVENGAYDADFPLWRELASAAGGPILDVGCGTGRVAIELARHGNHVLGVDIEPAFVAALRDRAAARRLEAGAVVDDILDLQVEGEFALVIVPMQTIQLFESADERRAAFEGMRRRLAPRGLIAVAIVCGDLGATQAEFELGHPMPDVGEVEGWVYSSLPTELRAENGRIVMSRLRQIVTPDGDLTDEPSEISLAILDPETVEADASAAGLKSAGRREIPETESHVASTVVLLEAA
ncbi:MAG TPA: class I SAM-dependent methyltransferase [Solirubrobacterales bacterium]|nr:class I SAM-dependent methyltransferase [Solirubrobacterales bacterium]